MTPTEFIAKWHNTGLGERQGAQSFFNDICSLVGHQTPAERNDRECFTFEKWVPGGFADAYLEERFGWEFKGEDSQLEGAFNQLLRYQVYLKTPPLLIVSSFQTILIRTNFPGMETILYEIPVAGLENPEHLTRLRWAFHSPAEFRPDRSVEDVTKETADLFVEIVADMERRNEDPEKLARYLNQIVFCLYAQDAGLLPEGLFTRVLRQHFHQPATFSRAVTGLFKEMAEGGLYGADEIAYFNGDLFNSVEAVELSEVSLFLLEQASKKDWSNIEPSIFGTLFERALDASKRAQLGAHYTSADDIMLVIQPVVLDPLVREWETARQETGNLISEENDGAARARLRQFQQRLFDVTVLDPACGSGNFLYLALRSLLDLEKKVLNFAAEQSWEEFTPIVKPDQMLGLDINHYAVGLARTALWIGYIQWHRNNGFPYTQRPILTPLVSIRQMDAILDLSDPENPREPEWPAAEFIVGNPPFLGGKLLRTNLGDSYVDELFAKYKQRVPAEADIVSYWFEKGREMVEGRRASRVGLLATQGIRGGANRRVLQRIKETGEIFVGRSDQEWILEGAAVHISIVGFDDGSETERMLDGEAVESINSNLTAGVDLTGAVRLDANLGIAFMGDTKGGPFDISNSLAQQMIDSPNPHGRSNAEVVKPWINGKDVTSRPSGKWIIDFGLGMPQEAAALYESPFEYVNEIVRPRRERSRTTISDWWIHERPRPEMRAALFGLGMYIVTPRVSKHRVFTWVDERVVTDSACISMARNDDYFFGVLHSRFHELWALAMGTQLESRPRYTPTTCFETFPFPEPTDEQREAIAQAARELNELRENWLNPPDISPSDLKKRTLTNLYNARPTWLDNLHKKLDAAVAAAYGWPADLGEQEILERLLELNLDRAWDELLASPESQEWVEEMAEETLSDVRAGRTELLDLEKL